MCSCVCWFLIVSATTEIIDQRQSQRPSVKTQNANINEFAFCADTFLGSRELRIVYTSRPLRGILGTMSVDSDSVIYGYSGSNADPDEPVVSLWFIFYIFNSDI